LFWTGILFGAGVWGASAWTAARANLVPDGRGTQPNGLAYIDHTHAERVSGESWRPNGLGGLQLTLMRNGYLVMSLPEFTWRRLQGAGLLVCAAPGRPFTAREREAARRFVEQGGILIFTVGWPEAAASRRVLAELGFYVGGRGAAEGRGPEPKPFGHFKAPYYNGGDYMAYVRFHAAWAVESSDPNAQPLAYGPRDPLTGRDPTVILMRRLGRGKVVVVADSEFATNQNLENEGGQPFEGLRENADFWRWLLSYLNDQPMWIPPRPVPETPAAASGASAPSATPPGAAPAEEPPPREQAP
jgi:DNA-binding transcriptional LysR family regulator